VPSGKATRRCVFLDRDGVINEKAAPHEYIANWSEFRLLPNISDWIRIFNALDFLVIVVTNQRGVARGIVSNQALDQIHRNMIADLAARGALIDEVFVCPHEENVCDCRKPKPGMVLSAQVKWNIDLSNSLLIGDSDEDQALASVCGLRFLRVCQGRLLEK